MDNYKFVLEAMIDFESSASTFDEVACILRIVFLLDQLDEAKVLLGRIRKELDQERMLWMATTIELIDEVLA